VVVVAAHKVMLVRLVAAVLAVLEQELIFLLLLAPITP
jgi:hypothetical protein